MIFRIEMIASGKSKTLAGGIQGIRDVLIFMVPWIKRIDLSNVISEQPENSHQRRTPADSSANDSILNWSYPSAKYTRLEASDTILNNMFYLTIKYGDQYISEIENIWVQLVDVIVGHENVSGGGVALSGGHGQRQPHQLPATPRNKQQRLYEAEVIKERNVRLIIEFLLQIGLKKRNPKFVNYAKKVVVYLARTTACTSVIESLLNQVNPKSFVPTGLASEQRVVSSDRAVVSEHNANEEMTTVIMSTDMDAIAKKPMEPVDESILYRADLEEVLVEMPKRPAFSKGQLACVLLVDLSIEVGSVALKDHLPLLLTVIFVQLDHFIALICEQNRLLLVNLIHAIIPREIGFEMIDEILITLNSREGKRMWNYEDISPKARTIESSDHLSRLVQQVADLFSLIDPTLVQSWGETALLWGTSCPVRHIACRSLQMLRTLAPAFSRQMLGELLHRLSNTVSDPTEEIQGFALEILETLDVMFESLETHRIILFPQFFWAFIACLYSPLEWEYLEAVKLLHKFLSLVDINDPTIISTVLNNIPPKWKNDFKGLHPFLLRGLSSIHCEQNCLNLINMLIPLENDEFLDVSAKSRVLYSVLVNVPRLLQGFELDPLEDGGAEAKMSVEDCLEVAAELSNLSERSGFQDLARLMSSYSKQKFRSRDDFLRQLAMIIRQGFFPDFKTKTLLFLMGFLASPRPFYRRKTLKILKLLLPTLESSVEVDDDVGEALVAPLLNQLQSELGSEALEVLDETMKGSISSEENNVRLVFGGRSIHKITKEAMTSSTTSGGPPSSILPLNQTISGFDENGWKLKDGMISSKISRYNMLGVASTCAGKKFLSNGKSTASSGVGIINNNNSSNNNSRQYIQQSSFKIGSSSASLDLDASSSSRALESTLSAFKGKIREYDEELQMSLSDALADLELFFEDICDPRKMAVAEGGGQLEAIKIVGAKPTLTRIDTSTSSPISASSNVTVVLNNGDDVTNNQDQNKRRSFHQKNLSIDYPLSDSDDSPPKISLEERSNNLKTPESLLQLTAPPRAASTNVTTGSSSTVMEGGSSVSRRLLSRPEAVIIVNFWLARSYEAVLSMSNMDLLLDAYLLDISRAVFINVACLKIVRVEPGNAGAAGSVASDGNSSVLISVQIMAEDHFTSVGFAEEILHLYTEYLSTADDKKAMVSESARNLMSAGLGRDLDVKNRNPTISIRKCVCARKPVHE